MYKQFDTLTEQFHKQTKSCNFMAFSCIFQLNNGAINQTDDVTSVAFIEDTFGKYQTEKVKIPKFYLIANLPISTVTV
jgi:hypothetical protein